jgi:hypothetical protein
LKFTVKAMNLNCLCLLFALIPAALSADPPDLMVLGNQIVEVSGHCPVRLHGVNVCGLEWSNTGVGPAGSPNPALASVQEAVDNWGSNFIRLPLNQDRWLGTACSSNGTGYQAIVTAIVDWCGANNAYVLLDLHWNDLGQAGANNACTAGQHDMPDDNSTLFWQSVAARYANNPAVFFDLYNEPGGAAGTTSLTSDAAGWNLWRNGGTVPVFADGVAYHTPGLQGLLNAIRAAGANNMVWAGGINWAFDLSGLPTYNAWLSDTGSGHGVVYATHIYPYKLAGNGCVTAACFNSGVPAAVKSACPVMVTEFAPNLNDPEGFISPLLAWINANNMGYSPFAMLYYATPNFILDWNYTPSPWFGAPVKAALLAITPGACASTPVPTPTLTHSPVVSTPAGAGQASRAFPAPNPNPVGIYVKLDGQADEIRARVYSPGMKCVGQMAITGNFKQGWNLARLPEAWSSKLPNGIYFVSLEPVRAGQSHKAGARLLIELLR